MKDDVAAIDELGEQRLVFDRVDEILEPGPALEVGDVVDRSGREVVEDQDLVPLRQQRIRQMRSDESGSACNERAQIVRSFQSGTGAPVPFPSNAWMAAATSSTCSTPSAGCSGNETTSSHARVATGQSAGPAAATAGCRETGTG